MFRGQSKTTTLRILENEGLNVNRIHTLPKPFDISVNHRERQLNYTCRQHFCKPEQNKVCFYCKELFIRK